VKEIQFLKTYQNIVLGTSMSRQVSKWDRRSARRCPALPLTRAPLGGSVEFSGARNPGALSCVFAAALSLTSFAGAIMFLSGCRQVSLMSYVSEAVLFLEMVPTSAAIYSSFFMTDRKCPAVEQGSTTRIKLSDMEGLVRALCPRSRSIYTLRACRTTKETTERVGILRRVA